MRTTSWSFGGNHLPQFRSGTIWLYDEPLWLAIAGWLIDSVIGNGCPCFHWIKLPKHFFITRDGARYSLRDYYGDFGNLYHIWIYDPLFQWHYSHKRRIVISIEVGYDRLKEIFEPIEPAYFSNQD